MKKWEYQLQRISSKLDDGSLTDKERNDLVENKKLIEKKESEIRRKFNSLFADNHKKAKLYASMLEKTQPCKCFKEHCFAEKGEKRLALMRWMTFITLSASAVGFVGFFVIEWLNLKWAKRYFWEWTLILVPALLVYWICDPYVVIFLVIDVIFLFMSILVAGVILYAMIFVLPAEGLRFVSDSLVDITVALLSETPIIVYAVGVLMFFDILELVIDRLFIGAVNYICLFFWRYSWWTRWALGFLHPFLWKEFLLNHYMISGLALLAFILTRKRNLKDLSSLLFVRFRDLDLN